MAGPATGASPPMALAGPRIQSTFHPRPTPMKLLGSLTSPYVRKVRIVMAEKKLDYKLELKTSGHPVPRSAMPTRWARCPA